MKKTDQTKFFPLAPIKRQTEYEELSKWQKDKKERMKNGEENKKPSATKLICDQVDREYYLVHYLNLQFYLKMVMKIKKVHSIIPF